MTDRPEPSPEDLDREAAREAAKAPPEPVPGAEHLPDDVKDGDIGEA